MSGPEAWTTGRAWIAEDVPTLGDRLEAIAALLAHREDVGGVETRDPSCIAEGPDFVAVERPELVAYTTPAARAEVTAALRALGERLGLSLELDSEDHEGEDWRDAWKRHYQPMSFAGRRSGRSLLLRPSWIPRREGDPEVELVLDPGRAFGTGLHESTRLCLGLLVDLDAPPTRDLDLGCGSGILGLAALRLWPERLERLVLADRDLEAVETARENAAVNGLHDEGGPLALCVEDLLASEARGRALADEAPFDLVLANIRPRVLIPAAARITRQVAEGGLLVLSGVLVEEAQEVRRAYPELEELERPVEADWCALLLRRPAARDAGAGGDELR